MLSQQVNEVEYQRHLGVFFPSDCFWHKHIDYIKEKAWTRIDIMRKLKYDLGRKSLETIYVVFIHPILECADVFWDNCSQAEKQDPKKYKWKLLE